jgi:hypothetical protein
MSVLTFNQMLLLDILQVTTNTITSAMRQWSENKPDVLPSHGTPIDSEFYKMTSVLFHSIFKIMMDQNSSDAAEFLSESIIMYGYCSVFDLIRDGKEYSLDNIYNYENDLDAKEKPVLITMAENVSRVTHMLTTGLTDIKKTQELLLDTTQRLENLTRLISDYYTM